MEARHTGHLVLTGEFAQGNTEGGGKDHAFPHSRPLTQGVCLWPVDIQRLAVFSVLRLFLAEDIRWRQVVCLAHSAVFLRIPRLGLPIDCRLTCRSLSFRYLETVCFLAFQGLSCVRLLQVLPKGCVRNTVEDNVVEALIEVGSVPGPVYLQTEKAIVHQVIILADASSYLCQVLGIVYGGVKLFRRTVLKGRLAAVGHHQARLDIGVSLYHLIQSCSQTLEVYVVRQFIQEVHIVVDISPCVHAGEVDTCLAL